MTTCQCCGQELPSNGAVKWRTASVRLSKTQRAVVDALAGAKGEFVSFDRITSAVWGGDIDGGPDDAYGTIRAVVHHVRPKLATVGLTILTSHGYGYALRPTNPDV